MLSDRIQIYLDHYKKENYAYGLNPFILGRDYAPNMGYEESSSISKQVFYKRDEFKKNSKGEQWTLERIKQIYSEIYLKEDY